MSFLRNIFRRKPKFERISAISGCKILYGYEAELEAQQLQIPIGYKFYSPITLIEKVVLPGAIYIVIDFIIHCRKHAQSMDYSIEASFTMVPQFIGIKLPCGCLADFKICTGNLVQIFLKVDSKFNLVIKSIREGHLTDKHTDSVEKLDTEIAPAMERMESILNAAEEGKLNATDVVLQHLVPLANNPLLLKQKLEEFNNKTLSHISFLDPLSNVDSNIWEIIQDTVKVALDVRLKKL